jgi:rRNA maturation protein Rpf1
MILVLGSDFWQSILEFAFRYSFEHFSQKTRCFATVLGTYPRRNAVFPSILSRSEHLSKKTHGFAAVLSSFL